MLPIIPMALILAFVPQFIGMDADYHRKRCEEREESRLQELEREVARLKGERV